MKKNSKRCKFCKSVCGNQKLLNEHLVQNHSSEMNGTTDENNYSPSNQNKSRHSKPDSEPGLKIDGIKQGKGRFCNICYVKHETVEELDDCVLEHIQVLKDDSDDDVETTDPGSNSVKSVKLKADDEELDAAVEVKVEVDTDRSVEPDFASNASNLPVNGAQGQSKRAYICDYCGVKRYRRHDMIKHLRLHLNVYFTCDLCGNTLKTKATLTKHMEAHGKVKSEYKCKVCCQIFSTEGKLRFHKLKYHTPFSKKTCDICSVVLGSPQALKRHLETQHLQSLNFPCAICNKQFRGKQKLNLHMQRHCEERRFICTHCSNKFKTNGELRRHIKRIHPANPELQCRKCRKEFKDKQILTEHVDKCLKQTFKCSKCPRVLSNQSLLNRHMKLHEKTYTSPKFNETFDLPGKN